MKRRYTATVLVEMHDDMDHSPLTVLSGLVLQALADADVAVVSCTVEEDQR